MSSRGAPLISIFGMETSPARRMWLALEPIHAVVYFEPTAKETYESTGLKGGWMGYFASRGAPLGPVPAEVIVATFYNFSPRMVGKRIPDAWALASISDILAARLRVVDTALRRILGRSIASPEVVRAAQLARRAAELCRPDGRPLYAAHSALEWPGEPHLDLWHAATLLREHRGDGHVASLVTHDISGLEANVLISAAGVMPAEYQQLNRGWLPGQWEEAIEGLSGRGLLDPKGEPSAAGIDLRTSIEEATDRLALDPYGRLGERESKELVDLTGPIAARVNGAGGVVYPNPMGLPAHH